MVGRDLFMRYLFKCLFQQVDPTLLPVAAQAFAEIGQRAQFKVPFPQLPKPQSIPNLHIIAKCIVHLLVRPAVA